MKYVIAICFLFTTCCVDAVVRRHDVADERYLSDTIPAFFVDMPFEGAAALIDEHWLLAPAHVIYTFMYDYNDKPIMIHGVENRIAEIILHPEFKRIEGDWSGSDAAPLVAQLNSVKDIALIRLTHPVTHLTPIALYTGKQERGMTITGFGRGAIGTGMIGEEDDSEGPALSTYLWYQISKFFTDWAFTQQNYPLRRYHNVITEAQDQWLRYTFEQGNNGLPLEGTIGSGDSGGAVVIYEKGQPILIGFAAWREMEGNLDHYTFGKYGATAVLTRVSYFNDWIRAHIDTP